MSYYKTQLERINLNAESQPSILITDSEGNKTNYLGINEESAQDFINFFKLFLPRKIEFERVNNDINGNPRYVCHYLEIAPTYEQALKLAKQLGGKKFDNKQFNGGIVFQSYNIDSIKQSIINLNK